MSIKTPNAPRIPAASLDRFVRRTIGVLTGVATRIAPTPLALTTDDKRRMPKPRKGAERIIPQLGTLIAKYGLDTPSISVTQMNADLEYGQSLVPLELALQSLLKTVQDEIFQAHSASVRTASYGYATLQRMARDDGTLATNLEPVSSLFAYRHPSVNAGGPSKAERAAQRKLRKATAQMAGRVERAKKTIARAAQAEAPAPLDETPTTAPQ